MNNSDEQNRILGPWSYVWYNILYLIPIVGFIFLIIHTFSNANLNRRNYARSFWCTVLVYVILYIVLGVVLSSAGVSISDYLPG